MWRLAARRVAVVGVPACWLGTSTEAAQEPQAPERRETMLHKIRDTLGPPRVHRIVITGGPCAGKTTAMNKLSTRLSDMGFAVYVVPELATLTITGGASPGTYTRAQLVAWETALLRHQMHMEDAFAEIATHCSGADRHSVLLCDRGTMDVMAYVGKETFDEVCEENGWTVPGLRDKRYNAVIHLVTAALGAPKFYTLANNKARMESAEEAVSLDGRLCRAWVGHNALHIIENAGSFEDKMVRVTAKVCESLGVPGPRAKPRWWIVEPKGPIPVEHAEWTLEHTFLSSTGGPVKSRVTKKSSSGNVITYHLRASGAFVDDEQSVSERTLSYREYKALLAQADPERTPIKKTRRAFVWDNAYYMLDEFILPEAAKGAMTLFVENPVEGRFTHLPPFLDLLTDVTEKNWFSSHAHDSWMRTKHLSDELALATTAGRKNNTALFKGETPPPAPPPPPPPPPPR